MRRVSEPLPIAVLVSGTGTNLQALLDTVHGREARIVAVASNVADAPALARAAAREVPTAVFARADYADRAARDAALGDWLEQRGARLVVLAGYMELLGAAFLQRFAGALINVHPSLLPAFPGIGAIAQALQYGVQVFGVTVHFVDDGVDTGAVIAAARRRAAGRASRGGRARGAAPARARAAARGRRMFARGELSIDAGRPASPARAG